MRKILSLLIAVVLGVSTAFATTVYCKMTHSWWTQKGAAVAVHYWGGADETKWPGVRMTPVSGEEGTWSYDVPADVAGLIFVRVNGTGDIADWGAQTGDLSLPTDGKNLFTITNETPSWGGNPGCNGEWSVYGEEPAPQMDTVYTWYGKRSESASATEAIETGGTAAAYGGNANIVVGTAQKTNWTIKLNKGFSNANYVGITLDKALAAGDKLQVAAFRTTTSDAVFGIDFSADAASAATTCQVLFPNNLQQITTNEAPKDTIFTIPECAAGAKFIRIYRNSGSTGVYVANFTILREGGATPEPPVEPQPQECDWDNIDFLGDGSTEQTHSNQFKVCKVGEQPNVVNIQTPGFATETGIYVNFPSAVFGEISLSEGQYVIQGAGMVLYLSAFTQEYTEVTVNWEGNDIVFTVYNAQGGTPEPTAISNTAADAEAVKVLNNGMLLIRKGNKTYNVMGQAVK